MARKHDVRDGSPDGHDAGREGLKHSLDNLCAVHANVRKRLYINGEYTIRFERWTRQESLGLLQFLLKHGQRPEFGVRFHWRPESVALWDKRQVWHLAVNDDRGMPRVMKRTVLKGTEPLPANP